MQHFALIGYPLTHSFSKKYFDAKFLEKRIEAEFENLAVEHLTGIKELIAARNISGAAVTIPHKTAIISYLDELTDDARAMNAVNCIRVKEGKLTGHNTDHLGFAKSLESLEPLPEKALVLGTGGAAKAIAFALNKKNIATVFVSRTKGTGGLTYAELDAELFMQPLLIVNCTPVGMAPAPDAAPAIPYNLLSPAHLLFDLVYNPAETLFLKKGKEAGCRTKNGADMFELQAEENWRIWNRD